MYPTDSRSLVAAKLSCHLRILLFNFLMTDNIPSASPATGRVSGKLTLRYKDAVAAAVGGDLGMALHLLPPELVHARLSRGYVCGKGISRAGDTLLHWCVRKGAPVSIVTELIVTHGFAIMEGGNNGETVPEVAAVHGNAAALQVMLQMVEPENYRALRGFVVKLMRDAVAADEVGSVAVLAEAAELEFERFPGAVDYDSHQFYQLELISVAAKGRTAGPLRHLLLLWAPQLGRACDWGGILSDAILAGHPSMISYAFDLTHENNLTAPEYECAAHSAVTAGDEQSLRILLAKPYTPRYKRELLGLLLAQAATVNNTSMMLFLLDSGADRHYRDSMGSSAFSSACRAGSLSAACYLAGHPSFDFRQTDEHGFTALGEACRAGFLRLVVFALETDHSLRHLVERGGQTLLMIACQEGHIKVVRYLFGHGQANIEQACSRGFTAMWYAAFGGHLDVVRYLHKVCPQSLEVADASGNTLAHAAANHNDVKLLRFLWAQAPHTFGSVNRKGQFPLVSACEALSLDAARLLWQLAPIEISQYFADHTFDRAIVYGRTDIIRFCVVEVKLRPSPDKFRLACEFNAGWELFVEHGSIDWRAHAVGGAEWHLQNAQFRLRRDGFAPGLFSTAPREIRAPIATMLLLARARPRQAAASLAQASLAALPLDVLLRLFSSIHASYAHHVSSEPLALHTNEQCNCSRCHELITVDDTSYRIRRTNFIFCAKCARGIEPLRAS